jgi:L-lysine exporter family protein LysE/ArgO
MTSASFLAGLLLSASLIVAIGAQNLLVLRQGLRREHVGPLVALCIALDLVLMTLGVWGLGASLGRHPAALAALAWVGAAFLVGYGVSAARRAFSANAMRVDAAGGTRALRTVLAQGLAISLLNPHVWLDTVALVGSVGARQAPAARASFLLGAGLASALWFTGLGVGARWLAPVFARPGAWRVLDGVVAATMVGLGVWLAVGAMA